MASSSAVIASGSAKDDPAARVLTSSNPASSPTVVPTKTTTKEGGAFYKSLWFWGAIGGAVAIGSTALIVANTGGASQMEMQMHIPR